MSDIDAFLETFGYGDSDQIGHCVTVCRDETVGLVHTSMIAKTLIRSGDFVSADPDVGIPSSVIYTAGTIFQLKFDPVDLGFYIELKKNRFSGFTGTYDVVLFKENTHDTFNQNIPLDKSNKAFIFKLVNDIIQWHHTIVMGK